MHDFSGSTVLITGAGSGIGAAAAHHLQQAGAQLVLMDREVAGLAAFPHARRLVGDVADEGLWAAADLDGVTHALVNAGISSSGRIEDITLAEWRRVHAVNLDGAFLSLQAALGAIRATGRGGAIVLTASVAGLKAEPGIATYATSKAAVIQLMRVAAKEAAADGIRVNAIAPGGVQTPIWRQLDAWDAMIADKGGEQQLFDAMAQAATPLGRYARPEEIAAQIAFLLSEDAAFTTGTCLVTDGGYTL